jgi:hypothetical protein
MKPARSPKCEEAKAQRDALHQSRTTKVIHRRVGYKTSNQNEAVPPSCPLLCEGWLSTLAGAENSILNVHTQARRRILCHFFTAAASGSSCSTLVLLLLPHGNGGAAVWVELSHPKEVERRLGGQRGKSTCVAAHGRQTHPSAGVAKDCQGRDSEDLVALACVVVDVRSIKLPQPATPW